MQKKKTRKPLTTKGLRALSELVPVAGLEPARPRALDFEFFSLSANWRNLTELTGT